MKKKYTHIDLFAGCGGLSLGLHQAEWKGLFAIEKSPLAFDTLDYNLIKNAKHFEWPKWLPKQAYDINHVLKEYSKELLSLRNQVDLVAGGPPCQGFSTAGKRQEDDSRNGLIKSYIKFIRIVQPKLIFFENVRGFTQKFEKNKTKGKKYSDYVINCLQRKGKDYIGYDVVSQLVDFSQFGIPQKRTRFILVGVRKDLCDKSDSFFKMIEEQREKFLMSKGLSLNVSLQDAISDLLMSYGTVPSPDSKGFMAGLYGKPESEYQKYLREGIEDIKQAADSHRFANHGEETSSLFKLLLKKAPKGKKIEGDQRKVFNIKKRGLIVLNEFNQSPTLTSHPDDYIHYSEPRILTVREYARIQSFPDWYEIKQKYTTGGKLRKKEVPRYTQLGNAIPPLFGELSGRALQTILSNQ